MEKPMRTATVLLVALLAGSTVFVSPELAMAGAKKDCHWETVTRRVWRNGRPHNVTTRVKRCFHHHH